MSHARDEFRFALQEAKRTLRIPDLWRKLGLPGEPKVGMNPSPFRKEKTPSFHIFDEGRMFKDFGNGENGDAVIFLEKARGLNRKDAIHEFIAMAGGKVTLSHAPRPLPGSSAPKTFRSRNRPEIPDYSAGTPEQHAALAKLRGLDVAAIRYAVDLGVLGFCTHNGEDTWLLVDSTKVNAQLRKMDGSLFTTAAGAMKSKTLPASWAKWPIGVPPRTKRVVLAEGGPDFLAACQLCVDDDTLSPVCMFGASCEIHSAALPLFSGTTVYIVPHRDEAGAIATARWTAQLAKVARRVVTSFLPEFDDVKDLNDLMKLPPEERGDWKL